MGVNNVLSDVGLPVFYVHVISGRENDESFGATKRYNFLWTLSF